MNRFENKAVIITGAAGGIGEATTRRIVSEGGKVVIADHSKEKAEQLAAELTQSGADVRPIYFSATELQSCKELIDFAMKEYGQVDILINNVGGIDPKRDLGIEKLDINYFDEVFHLNLCCIDGAGCPFVLNYLRRAMYRSILFYDNSTVGLWVVSPPSTTIVCPVIYRASFEARKAMVAATSSGSPK